MKNIWKIIVIVLLCCALVGCYDEFYKCRSCGAAYKHPAFRKGLPGQVNTDTCRSCGGVLREVSEEESGWDEDRYREYGNEIIGDGNRLGK